MNVVMTSMKIAMNPIITPISWRVSDWISGSIVGEDILGRRGELRRIKFGFLNFGDSGVL